MNDYYYVNKQMFADKDHHINLKDLFLLPSCIKKQTKLNNYCRFKVTLC